MTINLSLLSNAGDGMTTYYVGTDPQQVEHLRGLSDVKLYCTQTFDLPDVEQIIVEDPQLAFYKLSHEVPDAFTFSGNRGDFVAGNNVHIAEGARIGDGVVIEDDVHIGPNSVIYSKTHIGRGTRIDANVTIGTAGMMWTWDGAHKVFLQQLGGTRISENVIIGSNCAIVRGSANEDTIIEEGVNMAPGCNIGHGTIIKRNTHFANNITIGGSVLISEDSFIGCGAIINPRVKLFASNVIVGAGSLVRKDIEESGVYAGNPLKFIKRTEGKMSGVPEWKMPRPE